MYAMPSFIEMLMRLALSILSLHSCFSHADVLSGSLADQYNCSLKLAYVPECGSLKSSSYIKVNSRISLSRIKNIVPFGDSWT